MHTSNAFAPLCPAAPPPPSPCAQSFVKTTDPKKGLSSATVTQRQEEFGPNALLEKTKNPLLVFLSYFWVRAALRAPRAARPPAAPPSHAAPPRALPPSPTPSPPRAPCPS